MLHLTCPLPTPLFQEEKKKAQTTKPHLFDWDEKKQKFTRINDQKK